MRMIATRARVSVGVVQHHFGNKAGLVEAVNDELETLLRDVAPLAVPPPDPFVDMRERMTLLIAEHPEAIDYLAHLLIEDEATGRHIFDQLLAISKSHWEFRIAEGQIRPDIDQTWGALNPLILVLGTMILRSHIQRQLNEPFIAPAQLREWATGVNDLVEGIELRKLAQ